MNMQAKTVRPTSVAHVELALRETRPSEYIDKTSFEHAAANWLRVVGNSASPATRAYYRHNIITYYLWLQFHTGNRFNALSDALNPDNINKFVEWRGSPFDIHSNGSTTIELVRDARKHPKDLRRRDPKRTSNPEPRAHPFRARAALITIRAFANWIQRNCPDVHVRLVGVTPVRTNSEARTAYTDEEARRLLAATKRTQMAGRDYPLLYTALSSGLRLNELRGLRLMDLDLRRHLIRVRGDTAKNGKPRDVMVDATLEDVLRKYIADHRLNAAPNAPLWITQEGTEFTREGMRGLMRTLGRLAKVEKAQWHRCRHYYASALRRAGVELFTLRDQLGHSQLSTLLRYARIQPDQRPPMPSVLEIMTGDKHPKAVANQAEPSVLDSLTPLANAQRKRRLRMKLN